MQQTIRADLIGALFGSISQSELNPLEASLVKMAGRNPGALTALRGLSEVPGGIDALNRLITEQPGLDSSQIWDLYKSGGENPARFKEVVSQYLDAHAPAALRKPEVSLANGRTAEIRRFDHIYFTQRQAAELERMGIPYPREYFLVTGIGKESDRGADGFVSVMGSMGGRFTFSMDTPIVERVSPQGHG